MATERLVVAQDPPAECARILRGMKSRRNVGHTERWLRMDPYAPKSRYAPPLRHIVRRCYRLLAETVADPGELMAFATDTVEVFGVRTPVGESLARIGPVKLICWYHLTGGVALEVASAELEVPLAIEPGRMVLMDGRYGYGTALQYPPDDRYAIAVVWS